MEVVTTFNRGEVDADALARHSIDRVRGAAERMVNFLPLRLGPAVRRGGVVELGTALAGSRFFEFVYAIDDTALLEVGAGTFRVWRNDAPIARSSSTASVTDGAPMAAGGWTDSSGTNSSVTFAGGKAAFVGADSTEAILSQTISSSAGETFGLRLVIEDAPMRVIITDATDGEVLNDELGVGTHSLLVEASGAITVEFRHNRLYQSVLASVAVEGAGEMTLPLPSSASDIDGIRLAASAGQVFVAWGGLPLVIERRAPQSWSVVDYRADDGPFGFINIDDALTLTPSAQSGDTTLTASKDHFTAASVGTLRRLASSGQNVSATVTGPDTGTGSVRVTGAGDSRIFNWSVVGSSYVGTVALQRSVDEVTWETVDSESDGFEINRTYNDGLDNAVMYYRVHVVSGTFTGTADFAISYAVGSIEGICRIKSVTSSTVAEVQVLAPFGDTDATTSWHQSLWGDGQGHPSVVTLYEGRLWFGGRGAIFASQSDQYQSFDRDNEQPSRSIFKTIGFGPTDTPAWMGSAVRLGIGTVGDEIPVRSSSFGEPLTQDNASVRPGSQLGAALAPPAEFQNALYYIQRSGDRLHELTYQPQGDNFSSRDLMVMNRDIGEGGFVELAVMKQPEMRLFAVKGDGEVAIYLADDPEDVRAWSRMSVQGCLIKRVVTLPAVGDDQVYFVVELNGRRVLTKMTAIRDAKTVPVDFPISVSGPVTTITGLGDFNGLVAQAWVGERFVAEATVSGGSLTLPQEETGVTVGLRIRGEYRSPRIASFGDGPSVFVRKRIKRAGLFVRDVARALFYYGADETNLQTLPQIYKGGPVDDSSLMTEWDQDFESFPGRRGTDERLFIRADGPARLMAAGYDLEPDPTLRDPAR